MCLISQKGIFGMIEQSDKLQPLKPGGELNQTLMGASGAICPNQGASPGPPTPPQGPLKFLAKLLFGFSSPTQLFHKV